MDIINNIRFQIKMLFNSRVQVLWQFLMPIVFASFFYLAFSGIMTREIRKTDIAIDKNNQIIPIIEDLDLFKVKKVDDNSSTEHILNENSLYIDEDLNIITRQNGYNISLVKEILDEVKQGIYINQNGGNYDFEKIYVDIFDQTSETIIIAFYGLISMLATYSMNRAVSIGILSQPNLSQEGARISISPMKMRTIIISSILSNFIINFASNMLLIFYMVKILKLNIFTDFWTSILLIIIANIFAISFGMLIGASNSKDANFKYSLVLFINIFLSGIAGMMGDGVRLMVDNISPIINKINPMGIFTNQLYRINLIGNYNHLFRDLSILVIYSLLSILATYLLLRRKKYDSI